MAKDGTNRGGARIGAGAKKKPLADKLAEGNLGKRELTVIDFDNQSADLQGQPMPKPSRLLSAKQKDGKKLLRVSFSSRMTLSVSDFAFSSRSSKISSAMLS